MLQQETYKVHIGFFFFQTDTLFPISVFPQMLKQLSTALLSGTLLYSEQMWFTVHC